MEEQDVSDFLVRMLDLLTAESLEANAGSLGWLLGIWWSAVGNAVRIWMASATVTALVFGSHQHDNCAHELATASGGFHLLHGVVSMPTPSDQAVNDQGDNGDGDNDDDEAVAVGAMTVDKVATGPTDAIHNRWFSCATFNR